MIFCIAVVFFAIDVIKVENLHHRISPKILHFLFFFVSPSSYFMSKGAIVDRFGGHLNSTPLHWATRFVKIQFC